MCISKPGPLMKASALLLNCTPSLICSCKTSTQVHFSFYLIVGCGVKIWGSDLKTIVSRVRNQKLLILVDKLRVRPHIQVAEHNLPFLSAQQGTGKKPIIFQVVIITKQQLEFHKLGRRQYQRIIASSPVFISTNTDSSVSFWCLHYVMLSIPVDFCCKICALNILFCHTVVSLLEK